VLRLQDLSHIPALPPQPCGSALNHNTACEFTAIFLPRVAAVHESTCLAAERGLRHERSKVVEVLMNLGQRSGQDAARSGDSPKDSPKDSPSVPPARLHAYRRRSGVCFEQEFTARDEFVHGLLKKIHSLVPHHHHSAHLPGQKKWNRISPTGNRTPASCELS
jgi:hypothetical protein